MTRLTSAFVLLLSTGLAASAHAQSTDYTGSISSLTRQAPTGKLATQTEVLDGQSQAALITPASPQAMDAAIAMYDHIARNGGWPSVRERNLEKGDFSPGVAVLRQRLVAEGYLPPQSLEVDEPEKFSVEIRNAVKAFQANHGLAPTGKVDDRTRAEFNIPAAARLRQLQINQPRVAAYAAKLGPRYILVNIPSAQLEAVNFGAVYSRHNIVAGKIDRPSPALMSRISDINFNPYWTAPDSIVKRDLLPKLAKDPDVLSKMKIRVIEKASGREIDPGSVDWGMTPSSQFLFRQDPGDQNAMATVKINFPNKYAVYLHDTPTRELFGQNARYLSSGCIRVDRVQVLIDWILSGQDGFNPDMIETIAQSGKRLDKPVRNGPDLRIMYLTAWATEDGRIHFRPDIYHLDGTGFVTGQPQPRSEF
ncbi:L,D-transpeptidase family protein [Aestuariivirga sp. YIM B02566]|uniref:L,D-transpeptidase family protein n=1 Tax=Taklimakanibacter albus TaxID=2800327 RepID=A0ACC5QY97_9HYPH|nr:L,D-transpeptidase family protein [Aestuariivirga sp. YIM B02566]MBK1865370.1 L,D-transpeptidase family protein [Aestuariivirga sp. YIM B02566]